MIKLGDKAIGDVVKIKENGTAVNYIIVQKGRPDSSYDISCDGVWVLREQAHSKVVWATSTGNDYEKSNIKVWLNGTFLNTIDSKIREKIKTVEIHYKKGVGNDLSVGYYDMSCKVFLLTAYEIGISSSVPGGEYIPDDTTTNSPLSYFSGNNRICNNPDNNPINWWTRSPYTYNNYRVWYMMFNGGSSVSNVDAEDVWVRPAFVLPTDLEINSDGYIIFNEPPTTPSSITVPNAVLAGNSLEISWSAATDPEGTLSGYKLEKSADGGAWAQIYSGAALKYTDTVAQTGVTALQYRVKAYDIAGAESGYKVSGSATVIHNKRPTITSDKTGDLGILTDGFTRNYSVNDEDTADNVTVTLTMDDTVISTFTAIKGQRYTYSLTGSDWLKITNGSHTFKISATDGKETVENVATFTRACNSLSTTFATALPANDIIKACSLDVMGIIPDDAVCLYEVTNNGNDSSPVWEDCTEKIKAGSAYIFKNKTAENGFAFNFRIKIQRGTSGEGGYIIKVSGGFE